MSMQRLEDGSLFDYGRFLSERPRLMALWIKRWLEGL